MNSQDYRNLQEAYLNVYEQEVDEAKVDFTAGRGPSANDQYPGEGSPQDKGIRSAIRKIDNARTKAGHTAKSGSRANSAEQGRRQLRVLDTVTNKDAAEKKKLQDSYDQQLDEISIGMKRRAADASVDKVQKAGERFRSSTSVDVQPYLMKKKDKAEAQHLRLAKAAESYDLYDIILSHLIDEGYADTEEAAERIMVNMSEEWKETILEITGGKGHPGYKAGSRDLGPMQSGHPADSSKRTMKGGTMSMRHGDHLGDLDDDDDDDDDDGLEAGLKDSARKSRENVRKPLRNMVKTAAKRLNK